MNELDTANMITQAIQTLHSSQSDLGKRVTDTTDRVTQALGAQALTNQKLEANLTRLTEIVDLMRKDQEYRLSRLTADQESRHDELRSQLEQKQADHEARLRSIEKQVLAAVGGMGGLGILYGILTFMQRFGNTVGQH